MSTWVKGDDGALYKVKVTVEQRRAKRREWAHTDKRREAERKYRAQPEVKEARNERLRSQRREDYLQRPFVAWDGEGVTEYGKHYYCLLANSRGKHIAGKHIEALKYGTKLSSRECLDFLLDQAAEIDSQYPKTRKPIHIIYGGGYDFTKILEDFPAERLEELHTTGKTRYGKYSITCRMGRELNVRDLTGRSIQLYDILSFFQTSFVKACDGYLGTNWPGRDKVVKTKNERDLFARSGLLAIIEYNKDELENLVSLAEALRHRLYSAGIMIDKWYGPGAIAAKILKEQGVKAHLADTLKYDPDLIHAIQCAYAGGRFELLDFGVDISGPIYEYDINSAYPYAMGELPSMDGKWIHNKFPTGIKDDFALYHLNFDASELDIDYPNIYPLFWRSHQGNISYPRYVNGWYWGPEAWMAKDWV
jgi:hypothetical protein